MALQKLGLVTLIPLELGQRMSSTASGTACHPRRLAVTARSGRGPGHGSQTFSLAHYTVYPIDIPAAGQPSVHPHQGPPPGRSRRSRHHGTSRITLLCIMSVWFPRLELAPGSTRAGSSTRCALRLRAVPRLWHHPAPRKGSRAHRGGSRLHALGAKGGVCPARRWRPKAATNTRGALPEEGWPRCGQWSPW